MLGFILAVVAIVIGGLGYVHLRGPKQEESLRSRAMDIAAAVGVVFAVAIVMWLAVQIARADDGFGLHSGGVRIGLYDELTGDPIYCQDNSGVSGLSGEPEAFIDVYRHGGLTATMSYRHNSCAFGSDASQSSDRAGVVLEYRVW